MNRRRLSNCDWCLLYEQNLNEKIVDSDQVTKPRRRNDVVKLRQVDSRLINLPARLWCNRYCDHPCVRVCVCVCVCVWVFIDFFDLISNSQSSWSIAWMRQWGVNNLPKVVAQQRHGRGSNPRPLDRKSDALPLSHCATVGLQDNSGTR